MQRFLFGVANNRCPNFSAAFQNSENGCLVFASRAGDPAFSLFPVHIASLATDEGFIRFQLTGQFVS